MNVEELLRKVKKADVEIRAEKEILVIRGKGSVLERLLPDLRERKPELLAVLSLPCELQRDIETVASFHNFTVEDTCEAKLIAANDVENAALCFSRLVEELPKKWKRMETVSLRDPSLK